MNIIADNIRICHTCEHKQRPCSGQCLCTVDNIDILQHAEKSDCPKSKFVQIKVEDRKTPTVRQVLTVAKAMATGKRVEDKSIIEKRLQICRQCEWLRQDSDKNFWCGVCGCKMSDDDKKLLNLAAFEENLPLWGCKYKGPDGKVKSKWKEAGL